ncbi:MAG: glycosyltransferase family 4 protein [Candidatus Omnitrophota bacterium]
MRVGFDARMITHPGIGQYIKCLLPELARQAPGDEFILYGDPELLKDVATSANTHIVRWSAPIYSVQEQLTFPYDRTDIDLVHVPHFNVPVFCRKKMVVTIHDLIYLLFPESVPSPVARWYARLVMGMALKKAAKIITVSENTRNDLGKIFGKKYSEKISTIYEAAGKQFRRMEDKSMMEGVRGKYGLSDKIILYVGSVKPHKNISGLLKVYDKLREKGITEQLVIAGRWDKKEDRLKNAISGNESIKYLGEVPSNDLVALYGLADVLVHLSLYEGFGLTVLEAMQCGTPAVVSETSSLQEVSGEAGLAVSPLNIGQIADTVYNVIINNELRKGMIEAGLDRAKQFSWERAARQTLEIYHNYE